MSVSSRPYQAGFSLVELMIAMVLGLVIMTGATAVLLSNKQSYRSNAALSEAQESGRIGFELLARELRQTGLSGCGTQNRIANVLNDPGDQWYTDFTVAIRGYEGTPGGTGAPAPGNFINTADSVTLRGIEGSGLSIDEHNSPSANVKTNQPNSGYLQDGDIVVICDPVQAAIVQITNVQNNRTTVHNTGNGVATPGNCTKDLTYYAGQPHGADCSNQCNGGGATTCHEYSTNSQIAKLSSTFWYIGSNPQGGSSLYRQALGSSAAGDAMLTTQEMVRNVIDMQLEYLHPDAAGALVYMDADDAALTNWGNVTAVRMTLVTEGNERGTSTTAGETIARTFSSTVGLRNRLN